MAKTVAIEREDGLLHFLDIRKSRLPLKKKLLYCVKKMDEAKLEKSYKEICNNLTHNEVYEVLKEALLLLNK